MKKQIKAFGLVFPAVLLLLMSCSAHAEPIAAPTNVIASQGAYSGLVQVSWTASSNWNTGGNYTIYSDGVYCGSGSSGLSQSTPIGLSGVCVITNTSVHSFTVKAYDSATSTYGSASVAVTGFTAGSIMSAPTNVVASQGTFKRTVLLSWDASVDLPTKNESYFIYADGSSAMCGSGSKFSGTCDVSDGATHSYTVKASVTSNGVVRYGSASAPVTGFGDMSPLAPPANVVASQGTHNGYVRLSWDASPDMIGVMGSYIVYADGNTTKCGSTQSTYPVELQATCAATNDVVHSYIVKASKSATPSSIIGSASSSVTGYGAASAISAPTNLTASQGTNNGFVSLTWTADVPSGRNMARHYIYVDGATTACTWVMTGYSYSNTASCPTTNASVHSYRVSTVLNTGAASITSPLSVATTGYGGTATIAPPSSISASQGDYIGYVLISWAGETDRVYQVTADGSASSCAQISTQGMSQQIATAKCATNDTANHNYTVKAVEYGGSKYSVNSSAVAGYSASLAAPTNVTASQGTYSGYVKLDWTASPGMDMASGYYTIYADGNTGACGYSSVGSPAGLTGICPTANTDIHAYTVRANLNVGVQSASSPLSSPVMGFAYSPPASAPTNLSASQGTVKGGVQLTWSAATDTDWLQGYRILRDGAVWQDAGISTSFTDSLPDTKSHSYSIRASYANRQGADSAPVTGFSGGGKQITHYVYRVKI